MGEKIKFLKVRDVKSPFRANEYDAGIDFFVPKFTVQYIKDLKELNTNIFDNDYCTTIAYNNSTLQMSGNCHAGSTITFNGNENVSSVEYDLNDFNDTKIQFDEETGKNYFVLAPHSRMMLPSGIKSRMAGPGRALIANNKSGVATKHGLVYGAAVVDYTYKGEIHLSLINTSTKVVRIYEDMKILQFLETPIFYSKVEVEEEFYEYETVEDEDGYEETLRTSPGDDKFYEGLQDDRGDGGFGSTDKKEDKK